jgi:queuosine precursor transporter
MKKDLILTKQGKYGYKYLLFLAVLYNLTFPLAGIGIHKPVTIGPFNVLASTLIFPFAFVINDMIAEVYGYKVSRQLIWCILPLTIYYQLVLSFFIDYPPRPDWHYQYMYNFIFRGMKLIGFMGDIGVVVGFMLNSYLLAKLKIFLKGRFFWMRSIATSAIGELLQLLIGLFGVFIEHQVNNSQLVVLFINAYLFRLTIIGLVSPLANIAVYFLKKLEGVDIYDTDTNFSPFKFSVND